MMYVDCKNLNSFTIKHDYPIPIIDKLLDELFGKNLSPKLILGQIIFRFWLSHLLGTLKLLALIMGILNFWSCLFDCAMH